MKETLKMSLTLPALERLLGGDTELEVHLRHQVVEQFAGKHLKKLLNSEVIRRLDTDWRAELSRIVNSRLEGLRTELARGKGDDFVIDAAGRTLGEAIRGAVQCVVNEAVRGVIESQNRHIEDYVRRAVDRAVEQDISRRVNDGIQKRLESAVSMGES